MSYRQCPPPLEVPLALWRGVLALQASFGRARGEALGIGVGSVILRKGDRMILKKLYGLKR